MMNLKIENMKQAAYFDYFKSFSLNAFDTIKKLQTQFKDEIQESFFFDSSMMFKRIKTLLGSYEILIFEINDSCQFVQIPQFGNCILKIFLQIMSIIKFLLHKIVVSLTHKKQQPNTQQKNSKQKSSLNMTQTNLATTSTPLNQQQRMMYKKKQQSKYLISNLNQQLSLLQTQNTQNIQNQKKQYKFLIEGKQKLQGIQVSQNQNILSEALNNFCKKGQHLKNFVNIRQAAMVNNMKQGMGQYLKLKDILDDDSNQKLNNASTKLQQLFHKHTINYIKQKQQLMTNQQCQVNIIQQSLESKILQQNKHIKKLNQIIKKLSDQICFERQKSKSLEDLLKAKTQQFELKTMEYRVAKIQMENLKNKQSKLLQTQLNQMSLYNMSKHSLCSNCHNKVSGSPSAKKSQQCISRQIIQDDQSNLNQPQNSQSQETQRKIEQLLFQNQSRLMQKMNRRVHYQTSSGKKQIVFKNLDTKSDQFQLFTKVWQLKIQPNLIESLRKQSTKKKTILQRTKSGNVAYMNSTFSYRDHKRSRTKNVTLQSKSLCMQIQRVFSGTFGPYNKKNSQMRNGPQTKLLGITNYKKKVTQSGSQDNQTIVKQITQKWLDNDHAKLQQEQDQFEGLSHPKFIRNQTEFNENLRQNLQNGPLPSSQLMQQRPSTTMHRTSKKIKINYADFGKYNSQVLKGEDCFKQGRKQKSQQKNKSLQKQNKICQQQQLQAQIYDKNDKSRQLLKTQLRKSTSSSQNMRKNQLQNQNMNGNLQAQHQKVFEASINDGQFLKVDMDKFKFPKFNKFTGSSKITLSMKQLVNLYFDLNTAKNFQYVNLFQNDDIKTFSAKGIRRTNALSVNIQQMQKKNFINNLISKVKNQVTSMNTTQSNMFVQQKNNPLIKGNSNIITQCPSLNATFSGTMMKTHFWNNLSVQFQQSPDSNFEIRLLLKSYDIQKLTAILFKQIKDLKRVSNISGNNNGVYNYCMVRNFLRYPYSTITLANDKGFQQKQKNDTEIDYLELRKLIHRMLKIHKNCPQFTGKSTCTFEKIKMSDTFKNKDNCNNGRDKQNDENHQSLCSHFIQFYESLGILLIPSVKSINQ